jgi:hypothetical protein
MAYTRLSYLHRVTSSFDWIKLFVLLRKLRLGLGLHVADAASNAPRCGYYFPKTAALSGGSRLVLAAGSVL